MSAQTSYSSKQEIAYAGGLYDANAPRDLVSFSAEESIDFGTAVSRGTDAERQVLRGVALGYVGISVRDVAREGVAAGSIDYAATETVGVLREGYIWAVCPTGSSVGDGVVYANGTGILDAQVASGGVGNTIIDGATWETATPAGEKGVIRLRATGGTTVGS